MQLSAPTRNGWRFGYRFVLLMLAAALAACGSGGSAKQFVALKHSWTPGGVKTKYIVFIPGPTQPGFAAMAAFTAPWISASVSGSATVPACGKAFVFVHEPPNEAAFGTGTLEVSLYCVTIL